MIGLDGGGEVSTCTTTSGGRYAYVDKTCAFEEVNKPTYKLIDQRIRWRSFRCLH